MTDGRPKKRSLTLRGHRTSVSLEDLFWDAFRALATRQGKPINALAAEIDAGRDLDTGLASAIRLYVLRDALHRAEVVDLNQD
ncbi:ribbon-helix-helix domain-containing protein [Shimia ponticola]|uniref:ribbon-helix-helix domain-containing protein n=1 Tax=Shimia ponticola TaxID=2582893 RepID=UPI0011BD9D05|nr:ribbon-helix-helix domain-containing protein [Shimia ponticola]